MESAVKTIVTYTISDDDARNDLVDILEHIGFVYANDQSTMEHSSKKVTKTIGQINEFCRDSEHTFSEGDMISFYYPVLMEGNGVSTSFIKKIEYTYDEESDSFESL